MKVSDYLALWGPSPTPKLGDTANRRQVYLFLGVILGAISKTIYDAFSHADDVSLKTCAIAVIASFVIFAQLYYTGGLDRRKLYFAHWTLAFQSGFFWSVALAQLTKHEIGGG
jgi:hypothetical protein